MVYFLKNKGKKNIARNLVILAIIVTILMIAIHILGLKFIPIIRKEWYYFINRDRLHLM